ncbi:MAG: hypothetical protein DWQ02_10860 [Bacteroidetes bacterium]|nr:MAG: hypothetical protein DWQ02_10860 [Bacteroidota bacterium]
MKTISTQLIFLLAFIFLSTISYSQASCDNYDQQMSEIDGHLQKYPVDYNMVLMQLEKIKENCPDKAEEVDTKIQEVTAKQKAKIAKARKEAAEAARKRRAADMARRKALEEQPRQKQQMDRTKGLFASQGKYDQAASRVSSTGIYDNFPGYVGFYTIGLDNRKFEAPKAMQSFPEESGVIDIDICIEKNGNVVTAKINTSNTNISTELWHQRLIEHAKKFKFDPAEGPKQCGTIRYLFKKI